ncbi:MAG: hypothetical protein KAH32_01425 [Chlamydiia bacterium]|nr:hypothetical protein [Chlamydiia bacterium]
MRSEHTNIRKIFPSLRKLSGTYNIRIIIIVFFSCIVAIGTLVALARKIIKDRSMVPHVLEKKEYKKVMNPIKDGGKNLTLEMGCDILKSTEVTPKEIPAQVLDDDDKDILSDRKTHITILRNLYKELDLPSDLVVDKNLKFVGPLFSPIYILKDENRRVIFNSLVADSDLSTSEKFTYILSAYEFFIERTAFLQSFKSGKVPAEELNSCKEQLESAENALNKFMVSDKDAMKTIGTVMELVSKNMNNIADIKYKRVAMIVMLFIIYENSLSDIVDKKNAVFEGNRGYEGLSPKNWSKIFLDRMPFDPVIGYRFNMSVAVDSNMEDIYIPESGSNNIREVLSDIASRVGEQEDLEQQEDIK